MGDLYFTDDEATDAERAALDAALGEIVATDHDDERLVRAGESRRRSLRHHLLPGLWALQTSAGWVSPGGLNELCARLGVPPAEGFGVASFYDLLATDEAPADDRPTHWVCTDVSCRLSGEFQARSDELTAAGHRVASSPCLGQCERDGAAVYVQARGTAPDADPGFVSQPPVPQSGEPQLRVLARVGRVDPESLDSYVSLGGYAALPAAMALGADGIIDAVSAAGLSGRGGAAFPAGIKWRAVRDAVSNQNDSDQKHIVVNADESETGTFKDRVLMENDPFGLIEATTIAGFAVGATKGWIYIRGEYPVATRRLQAAIDAAREAGFLGDRIGRGSFGFDIEIRRGAGAYICGEETALFNSIEGFRGEPRQKPPFPTQSGLFGQPTSINNVETLYNVLPIIADGPDAYRSVGTEGSPGTRLFCLSGNVANPGVYEHPFGVTLGEVLERAGGVTGDLQAVLLGGAAGSFVGPDSLGLSMSLEATRAAGTTLGSGVVIAFNQTVDMVDVCERISEFFRHESCGQCVPCRVGAVRQHEQMVALSSGKPVDWGLHDEMRRAMADASICGLGHTAANAVASAQALGLIGGTQ